MAEPVRRFNSVFAPATGVACCVTRTIVYYSMTHAKSGKSPIEFYLFEINVRMWRVSRGWRVNQLLF
jgi:hypothetical protein